MSLLDRLTQLADRANAVADGYERMAEAGAKASDQAPVPLVEKGAGGTPGTYTGGSDQVLGTFGRNDPSVYNAGSTTVGGTFGYGGAGIRAPDTTPGRGGFKRPADPSTVKLVSWDGKVTTTMKFIIGCIQQGTCRRVSAVLPGNSLPVEVFDATIALQDASALFPTAQLAAGGKLSGGGSSGSGASAGGSGGSLAAPGGPSPNAGASPPPPTVSGKAQPVALTLQAPKQPTPGELLIVKALDRQTAVLGKMHQEQKRDDMGLSLRRLPK